MLVAVLTLTLSLPWVTSLKGKRSEVKHLLERSRDKFHVSAAESGAQDYHQTAELSFAALVPNHQIGDSCMEQILSFVQANTEGEVVGVQREYR